MGNLRDHYFFNKKYIYMQDNSYIHNPFNNFYKSLYSRHVFDGRSERGLSYKEEDTVSYKDNLLTPMVFKGK